MQYEISFEGKIQKFPGVSGWHYIAIPIKYTKKLKEQRRAWGKYPITASIGNSTWKTKLMTMKGGDLFVALKANIREKNSIAIGNRISISIKYI
jgi:hypothetical protein